MKYRKLGKSDINVSVLGIGAWQLGGPLTLDGKVDGHPDPGKENVLHWIRELGQRGINFIDTAEQYGDGESERRVGEAIKPQRSQWIISTKFGARRGPNGERINDPSPTTIQTSLEGSLKRLQTDYIDIYLFHIPPKKDWIPDCIQILEKMKSQGKIRTYGISTNNIHALDLLLEHNGCHVLQFACNMLRHQPEFTKKIQENQLGAVARGTMGGGLLSGKYFDKPPVFHPDDNRNQWLQQSDFLKYSQFKEIIPKEYTMAQMALRYVLDLPFVDSVLLGSKSLEEYLEMIETVDKNPLDENIVSKIGELREQMQN